MLVVATGTAAVVCHRKGFVRWALIGWSKSETLGEIRSGMGTGATLAPSGRLS
jgi:hypothetical protein